MADDTLQRYANSVWTVLGTVAPETILIPAADGVITLETHGAHRLLTRWGVDRAAAQARFPCGFELRGRSDVFLTFADDALRRLLVLDTAQLRMRFLPLQHEGAFADASRRLYATAFRDAAIFR